jgi:acyl-CoA thioester hydrolase
MNNFSTKLVIRIDWSEIDLFGHINNLAIMKYVQAARINYLETIGLMQLQAEAKIGPVLASINCQFRKPLFYPGQITIYSRVEFIKETSFKICHKIYNDKNEVSADAQDIIVLYDFVKNIKFSIPNEIKEKIAILEDKNCDFKLL